MTEIEASLADPIAAAAILTSIGARTGDKRYIVAAAFLRGRRNGRPKADDTAALQRMRVMLADGTAATIESAARFVARALPGERSSEAATKRLAKKYRIAKKDV